MITAHEETQLLNKLKSLSEIELQSILPEFSEHLRKNNMLHLFIDDDSKEELEDLREALRDIKRTINELI